MRRLLAFAVQDTVVIRTYNLISDYGGMNMAASLKEIEQQARALATEERAKLAEVLLASLQTPPLSDIERVGQQAKGALCARGMALDVSERLRGTQFVVRVRTANGAVHTLRLVVIQPGRMR